MNGLRGLFKTQSNVYDGTLRLKVVNSFRKKGPSLMFDWVVWVVYMPLRF